MEVNQTAEAEQTIALQSPQISKPYSSIGMKVEKIYFQFYIFENMVK